MQCPDCKRFMRRTRDSCGPTDGGEFTCANVECTPDAVLAKRLKDAWSTNMYDGDWGPSIKALRRQGYDTEQIETIIRSKLPRWASDAMERNRTATATDLLRYLAQEGITPKTLASFLDPLRAAEDQRARDKERGAEYR